MRTLIRVFISIMRFFYSIMKKFPVNKKKVVFCSRQANETSLDFRLIQKSLTRKDPSIKCVNICKRMDKGLADCFLFVFALFRSMYHMATSRVCVVDSYWPAVSILDHKPDFKVIQIWHSIGKMKKSGYQTVGKESGREPEYAKLLKMHEQYDYIIAGAPSWNKYYCASFNVTEDKLLNYGLPRIDYLINTESENRKRFFEEYPELKGKKIILYAPTFRKKIKSRWYEIFERVEWDDDYALVIKRHPQGSEYDSETPGNVYYPSNWNSIDLISVCDYLITDYSAIALEAAVLSRPVYWWIYDYDEYKLKNGLNIDIEKEMQPYAFRDIQALVNNLKTEGYDKSFMEDFRKRFLHEKLGGSTEKISTLIIENMK